MGDYSQVESCQLSGSVTVSHSCVQGWTGSLGGEGNIGADPHFTAPGYWDGTTWMEGNYYLDASSPCIDAGDNDGVPAGIITDLAGDPRFADDPNTPDTGSGTPPIVDMGAYEYQRAAAPDSDGDGDVDLADFAAFSACFNGPNRPPASGCAVNADFDGDNDVDLADFGVFSACFNGPNRPPACE